MTPDQMQAAMGSPQTNQPVSGQFTPQSMAQAMGGGTIQPNQAAVGLGHSTGIMTSLLKGAVDIGTGADKQIGRTLLNVGGGIESVLDPTVGRLENVAMGKGFTPTHTAEAAFAKSQSPEMQPTNLPQKIGDVGASVGEFFLPGGAEKGVAAKAAPAIEAVAGTGKLAKALSIGQKALTSALSFGGITAAQTGDKGQAKGAAELGTVFGGLGGVMEQFGPGLSKALQKADFRMTPIQESKAGKVADNAATFMTKHNIMGSEITKYAKLSKINQDLESTLQSSLPKGVAVPKEEIIRNIEDNVETLRQSDPAIYSQARSKADEAIGLIREQKGDTAFTKGGTLSVKDALQGKRSWGSMAFKTSRKAKIDPTVSSDGAYAVEQGYQKALEDTLTRTDSTIKIPPSMQRYFDGQSEVKLADFNKVYSDAINAKSLTGIAQHRNDAGLFGRLFGLWTGKAIGQTIMPGLGGEIVGAGVGEAAATRLPGFVRQTAERALQFPEIPETGAKVYQATENQ